MCSSYCHVVVMTVIIMSSGSEMSDSDDAEFERDRRSEKTVTTGTQIK